MFSRESDLFMDLLGDLLEDLFWFGTKVRSSFCEKLEKRFACIRRFARCLRSFTVLSGLVFNSLISCFRIKASSSSAKNCSLLDLSII